MVDNNMERIVARLKDERTAQEQAERRLKEQRIAQLETDENIRLDQLEEMLGSWYEAMQNAGYLGAELFQLDTGIEARLGKLEPMAMVVEEAAGWIIGAYYDDSETLNDPVSYEIVLLADRRLVQDRTMNPHVLGSYSIIDRDAHEPGFKDAGWRHAELAIPQTLRRLAEANRVAWEFEPKP